MAFKTILYTLWNNIGVMFNIFNTIIGVGIITLPKSINNGGFFFMFIYACICVFLIWYTSILMASSSQKNSNIKTYGELCYASYKDAFRIYVCFLIFCLMFGFVTVYNITLRTTISEIISDFTGETFKYGIFVLLAISILTGVFCCLKSLRMLSYISFVSTICVLYMVLVSVIRAPFYHSLMSQMTKEKMISNERKLHIDRAIWVCESDHRPFLLKNFASIKVANWNVLDKALSNAGACKLANKGWNSVLKAIENIEEGPKIEHPLKDKKISNWAEAIHYEHARHLFNEYSLNDFGREVRGFSFVSFANGRFFITMGTIASAFIYQQASIENFYSMKVPNLKDYRLSTMVTFVAVLICCMLIGYSGYLGQEYQVGQFVFTKMRLRFFVPGEMDPLVTSARIALVISIILTLPMQFFFGRVNLMIMIIAIKNKIKGTDSDTQNPNNWVFYISTAAFFVPALIMGMFYDKAGDLFSIIGSAFAGQMIYILPIICWYKLSGGYKKIVRDAKKIESTKEIFKKIVLPNFIAVFGIVITISSTIVSVLQVAKII